MKMMTPEIQARNRQDNLPMAEDPEDERPSSDFLDTETVDEEQ